MVKKKKRELPQEGPPDASLQEINQVILSKSTLPTGFNSSKLTIELLESTTTQLVRRLGWFRDVRLRRAADSFMKSHSLHQKATARLDAEGGFEKPSHQTIQVYEEELQEYIQKLQDKMKVVPMNERRDIKVKLGNNNAALAKEKAKLAEMKARAAELAKKPQSVIKSATTTKKKTTKGGLVKKVKKPDDMDDV
mmetsp:Transcript_174341/g.558889  ORF Transcript_174341/g.558889 Transcript_174341/m.558889 type:complete len:194 (+) Transcript_174341:127-708(+)